MSASYSPLHPVNDLVRSNNDTNKSSSSNIPLLLNNSAPMAKSEIDDDIDDTQVDLNPYSGVDDGFFEDKNKRDPPDINIIDPKHSDNIPDIEVTIPTPDPTDEIPEISLRFGDDDDEDGKKPDDIDGVKKEDGRPISATPFKPHHLNPNFGIDLEAGSTMGDSIPDVNIYQHKKTLAQGMMDLALFSANANQLRYVLESSDHPYYYPSVILISISLIVQIAVGVGLIWNATYNVKDEKEICIANKINNFTVIGIFLVTVVNVFISAFGVGNIKQ